MTECSPDSIAGALTATMEAVGIDATEAKLAMNKQQKQGYTAKSDDIMDASYRDGSKIKEGDGVVIDWITGSREIVKKNADGTIPEKRPVNSIDQLINASKYLFYKKRNASDSLGDEIILPFQDIMEKANSGVEFEVRAGKTKSGKSLYYHLVEKEIAKLEKGQERLSDNPAWDRYKTFLLKGGALYADKPKPDLGTQIVNNVVSNTITGNFNVFGGNLIEMIKVPTMYGGDALKTINAINFSKRPELINAGVFNDPNKRFEKIISEKGDHPFWQGLIKKNNEGVQILQDLTFLFDTPMKNWAYEAGKARGGHDEGLRAVQRITFNNRLADPTFEQMDANATLTTQLTNYTMGTARFYGHLWKELASYKQGDKELSERAKQALGGLVMYHVGLGISAGTLNALQGKDFRESFIIGASQVPVLYSIAEELFPDLKEMAERNKGAGTQLVKAGSLNGFFIGVDIAQGTIKGAYTAYGKALDAVRNGDPSTASLEGARGLIKTSVLTPTVLGTKTAQGVTDWLLDWWEGDFEADEALKQLAGRTTPYYKDEVEP